MGMKLEKSWHEVLGEELKKPYIQELKNFLEKQQKADKISYPPEPQVFNAFLQTPYPSVKVVIIGQDPYHGVGQAHGLSFSVPCGMPYPPSLRNIFEELKKDVKISEPETGCLTCWAKQGVLLLNATLTVEANKPKSHYGQGWEQFTDAVVAKLLEREDPLVFLLWGKSAQEKVRHISEREKNPHVILEAPHPSPYSVHSGFFGCQHFSKTNEWLKKWGKKPIDWSVKIHLS